jgi:hypothetical protein
LRKRRSEEVVEMEMEILERLAERMRRSVKSVGFGMFGVLYEWVLIWRVLFISCMDEGYVEVLGLLRDYLDGRVGMKELREKLEEIERVYEERLKQVKVEGSAGQGLWREEEVLF